MSDKFGTDLAAELGLRIQKVEPHFPLESFLASFARESGTEFLALKDLIGGDQNALVLDVCAYAYLDEYAVGLAGHRKLRS